MQRTATQFLGADVVAALRRPVLNDARGLPASVYTSDTFFDLEQQRLFPRAWMGVAFDTEVPEIGDAIPRQVLGLPIIIVRDESGGIRAFHNVCRHRATLVLPQPCTGLTRFQCPYHAWTYGLDGTLLATPFWDGTADAKNMPVAPEQNSLQPIRCGVWNHVVFVNIDGNAPPLAEYLAPMTAELEHLDIASLEVGHSAQWNFNANWKLVLENWEVYHHVWVHEGVFDKMSDEVDLRTGVPYTDSIAEGNVMILRPTDDAPPRPSAGPPNALPLPTVPQKWAKQGRTGAANAVLPNTTVTLGPVAYVPAVYTPIAPGITRASMAWFFAPGAGTAPEYAAGRDAVLDRWLGPTRKFEDGKGIRPQDHRCMELQQAARASPVANDVKFSSTWEADVRYFQDWLVRALD